MLFVQSDELIDAMYHKYLLLSAMGGVYFVDIVDCYFIFRIDIYRFAIIYQHQICVRWTPHRHRQKGKYFMDCLQIITTTILTTNDVTKRICWDGSQKINNHTMFI